MTGGGPVSIVGAGAWGTALAVAAVRAGNEVFMWARDAATVAAVNTRHRNVARLPDVVLDGRVRATADIAETGRAEIVVLAVPTQALRPVAASLSPVLSPSAAVVVAAKGLERGSERFPLEVVREVLPRSATAVLSGPSFADDVARGLPTAVTLAADDEALARRLADRLGHPAFRPYTSDDPVGTQIGGAVKNVLAIACGIVAGRALGASALAALVARGFAEMNRFGAALGARPETLSGLSGLGDLVLTATSAQSRNYSFGHALGRGEMAGDILAARRAVTEGVWTAPALVGKAHGVGVEMPICEAVRDVLAGDADIDAAIEGLLSRPLRSET